MDGMLSQAALRWAEAMCPVGDAECVQKVGSAFERRIEERFGVLNASPPPPVRMTFELSGPSGRVGELRYVDGVTSLCLDHPAPSQPKCAVIGDGTESVSAALNLLQILGLTYRQTQS